MDQEEELIGLDPNKIDNDEFKQALSNLGIDAKIKLYKIWWMI